MRRFITLSSCILLGTLAHAQQKPGVKLLAKVKDGSVLLRWAPTNSLTWSQANQKGYRIERYVITRKNDIIKKPEKIFLTPSPLKPKPLEQWRSDAKENDYSAIAAQAIYGSSFEVTLPQNGSLTEVVNRSKELEQRFSFALFAADHSFQTAKLSALGFKDSTVKKDERYLYRVYVANQDSKIKLDTGIFYLGLQDTVGLTPPMHLTAQFADRTVLLKWPKSFVQRVYTSFIIERSEAGGEFIKRNSAPYINSSSDSETEFFQTLDSLPKNGVEYQYRIRGITPFGELGPESERVGGRGFEKLNARASIIEAKEEKGKVYIRWNLLGNQKLVTGHYVERASDAGKNFQHLHEKPLSPEATSYIDQSPQSTGYYRIKSLGENGQSVISFPVLVQLADSIPPEQPQGLKVNVDSTGIAKLSWAPNHENDLLGYKIYRSNFSSTEFSEINHSVLFITSYSDRLNIKTLSAKVFYKLAAFDKRMNRSHYSTVVEAELPDVIPPQPPQFKEIRPDSSGIFLAWNKSSSGDVICHQLQRKVVDSTLWKNIRSFNEKDSSFYLDLKLNQKLKYQYQLIAIDKNGLRSAPSITVMGKALENKVRLAIKNLTAQVNRESKTISLRWEYNEPGVSKYLIYRATGDEPMALYKTISGNSTNFTDANLKMDTRYQYRVKSVFWGGDKSEFSKEIKMKY